MQPIHLNIKLFTIYTEYALFFACNVSNFSLPLKNGLQIAFIHINVNTSPRLYRQLNFNFIVLNAN